MRNLIQINVKLSEELAQISLTRDTDYNHIELRRHSETKQQISEHRLKLYGHIVRVPHTRVNKKILIYTRKLKTKHHGLSKSNLI